MFDAAMLEGATLLYNRREAKLVVQYKLQLVLGRKLGFHGALKQNKTADNLFIFTPPGFNFFTDLFII